MEDRLLTLNGKILNVDGKALLNKGIIPQGKIDITTTDEIDVTAYATAQVVDEDLIADNIKKDVNILGVTGTFEGAGGNEDLIEAITNNTLVNYSNSNITKVKKSLFQMCSNLESVDLPNVTAIEDGAFNSCSSLISADFPLVTNIASNAFSSCYKLASVNLPSLTTAGSYSFQTCQALENVYFPLLKECSYGMFTSCKNLTTIKLNVCSKINNSCFSDCKALTDVYLGYSGLVTLGGTTVFNNVITQGYINVHVRSEYSDQYATATNWSSLIANGTIVIVGDYSD